MRYLVLMFMAGGAGALARYGLSSGVYTLLGRSFPWGTFVVNILGCLLFGLIWELSAVRMMIKDTVRELVLTGFMGSFTTFSALMFDSHMLWRSGALPATGGYLAGQILTGYLALRLGMLLAHSL